jgi:hypothetical protein
MPGCTTSHSTPLIRRPVACWSTNQECCHPILQCLQPTLLLFGSHLFRLAQVVQRLTAPHYYGALCLLVDEAGFLVESKTAALIAELPANEAKLVAAESIVRALGVTDGPGFDALMDALTADGSGSISNAGGEWGKPA